VKGSRFMRMERVVQALQWQGRPAGRREVPMLLSLSQWLLR
jgi:hypothetical protein